ncbi:AI-2E family transporter [Veronia nyctiphanis]|uniref:AI-2E family transporter n=1 Tax=Veronia nyctiphanis TaxID=1278244 RepID=A0A4V1LT39_9GAMM|nr:AI-2E family transporter [Veronia nyctiphanis]RXJ73858.1 AI-2E family transporter [Veronia nyctiphanis]
MASKMKIETRHWTLIVALLIAFYACYTLIEPYVGSIVLAFIVSLLFAPLHGKIKTLLPNKSNLAAALSCLLLTVIIIIPLIVVFAAILNQGLKFFSDSYAWFSSGGAEIILNSPQVTYAINLVNSLPIEPITAQEIAQKAASTLSKFSGQMLSFSSKFVGDITGMFVNFLLMLFVLFFLLRDHAKIIQTLRHVIPLSRSQEDTLLEEVEKVAKSAVLGSFLTALAQGLVGGFAMWLAGFPGLFWGTMMAFASFIPVVGTALIWLPSAIYLLLIGQWEWGIFLIAWGALVVGSVDNILRPLLMQGNSGMNTLLIFFSLIGGLHVFGLMGLIYGPIVFSVTLVLFHMYEIEFHQFLDKQDNS